MEATFSVMIEVLELSAVGAVSCAFLINSHRWLDKVFAERRFSVRACVCLSFSLELFVACKNTRTHTHTARSHSAPFLEAGSFATLRLAL